MLRSTKWGKKERDDSPQKGEAESTGKKGEQKSLISSEREKMGKRNRDGGVSEGGRICGGGWKP